MRRANAVRTIVFAGLVMMLTFGIAAAALAAPSITQTPNYSGQTWAVGSTHPISWTSAELAPTDTLSLTIQKLDGSAINVVAAGLPQNGTYNMTIPADVGVGADYVIYLMSTSDVYSDAVNDPWLLSLSPAPAVSTPASSPWSLALAALAALGLIGAVPVVRRRTGGSEV